jgi:hypothetical protein
MLVVGEDREVSVLVRQNIYAAYEELDGAYKDYERVRETLRGQISEVVEKLGGTAVVKGFGMLIISSPVVVKGFDKASVAALITELEDEGELAIAERLRACQTQSARSGGLRIERERGARD